MLVEAMAMLAAASFMVAFIDFQRLTSQARPTTGREMSREQESRWVHMVGWAIRASARRVPWRAKCLEQAFAAHWMLRRRSVSTVIHYGIARRNTGLAAH